MSGVGKTLAYLKDLLKSGSREWAVRRGMAFAVLIACGAFVFFAIGFRLIFELETSTAELIISSSFWLAGAIVNSYLVAATVDQQRDKSRDVRFGRPGRTSEPEEPKSPGPPDGYPRPEVGPPVIIRTQSPGDP